MEYNDMIRAKIIDIIRSVVGGKLRIDNLAEYKETYAEADMTDNTIPPWSVVIGAIVSNTPIVYSVYIYGQTGLVIDWKTDLIDGFKTYYEVFGDNVPKPFHYFIIADDVDPDITTLTRGGVEPSIKLDRGVIITVTFDWGYVADSLIVF